MSVEPELRAELDRVIDVLIARELFPDIAEWPLDPKRGMSDSEIDALLPEAVVMPIAVRDHCRLLGRHPINECHNWLRPVDRIEIIAGKVVFLDENQSVVMWGIDEADVDTPDPEVWQAIPEDDEEEVIWYSEEKPFTQFIAEMWRWTITGEGHDSPTPRRPVRIAS